VDAPRLSGRRLRDDPVWRDALDWFLRARAAPGDRQLAAERDRWLAADPAHARAYARAERVWRLTGELPPARPLPRARRGLRLGLAAAAAVAACLLAVAAPTLRLHLEADHLTDAGARRTVTLADGSAVELDAGSAVAVRYTGAARGVDLLRGAAFFRVLPNAERPFRVVAGEVSVTVTGTAFEVERSADAVAVAVESGSVRVGFAVAGAAREAALRPGERLTVGRGGATLAAPGPGRVASWRSGRLAVDGATVAEVTAAVRRHHAGVIVLADAALAQRRVTGIFDLADPAAALAAAVQPHAGRVRVLTPWVLVVSAGG